MVSKRALAVCVVGSILFYIPFAARFFMGDDWLWLATGIRTLHDPAMLLERPMYGYWRPLYSAWMALWMLLVGAHPWFYSLVSLVLHGLNACLLYSLLLRMGAARRLAAVAGGLFAVYYLNAPVVTWIAPAHDMIVTALGLVVCLTTLKYIETQKLVWYLAAILCWLLAALTKESGFVSIAPALLLLLLYGRSPFKTPALWPTLGIALIGAGYLIFYFSGRVYIDKELVLQPSALINLWYLLAYLIFPLSARVAAMVPSTLHLLLPVGKVVATVAVPVLVWFIWRKGETVLRFFALWSSLFVLPIVLFDWNVSLLSLYPERTVSRFLYTSNIGTMVLLGWGLVYLWRRLLGRLKGSKVLVVVAAALIVVLNGAVIYKITGKYRTGQSLDRQNYVTVTTAVESSNTSYLTIIVHEQDSLPQFIADTLFIKAMALVGAGREVSVHVSTVADTANSHGALLWWDQSSELLSATPLNSE
jgi:hypothetical protein